MKQTVNVYSRSPFSMYGRGLQTIVTGFNRDNPQIYIDTKFERLGSDSWSVRAVMRPPDSNPAITELGEVIWQGSRYGEWVSLAGTMETGNIIASGAPGDAYSFTTPYDNVYTRYNDTGSVYMYKGEWSSWTNTQKLRASDPQIAAMFGICVEICPVNPRTMVIGAKGDATYSFDSGAAYVFRSSPTGRYWTQSQKLLPESGTYLESFQNWFGYRTKIYDEFIFVSHQKDDDMGINTGSVHIFREERKDGLNMWSQQQKLYSPIGSKQLNTEFGEFLSVYGRTLVIGSSREDDRDMRNAGVVYVYKTYKTMEIPYHPPPPSPASSYHSEIATTTLSVVRSDDDTVKPKPKPVPMFKWWSLQQRLLPSDAHSYRYFGTYTTLYGDGEVIGTGAYGEAFDQVDWGIDGVNSRSGSAYVFVKDYDTDHWSQQQKFISPTPEKDEYFSDPYFHGSDLIIRNTEIGYVYTDKNSWKCLTISIADHFGDGWGKSYLEAYAPDELKFTKRTDVYAPRCDSPNPLVIRYCPLLPEDVGVYLFKMSDNVKEQPFWNEIQYEVVNERDGTRYYGNAETSLSFSWHPMNLEFRHIPSPKDKLVDVSECVACSTRLYPKPTPSKGDDDRRTLSKPSPDKKHTRPKSFSPTISPAPTITNFDVEEWNIMQMSTLDHGWFGDGAEKNGTGTMFYIYDETGKNLMYTGTICGTTLNSANCPVVLNDGRYILRVGGKIDKARDDHQWTFCGQTGRYSEMLTFGVSNGHCKAYNSLTVQEYCSNRLGLVLTIYGTLELTGIHGQDLTHSDLTAVGAAIKYVSPLPIYGDVKVTIISTADNSVMISFTEDIDMDEAGLSGQDEEDCETAYEMVSSELIRASTSGRLAIDIIASAESIIEDTDLLRQIASASLMAVENGGPGFNRMKAGQIVEADERSQEIAESVETTQSMPTALESLMKNALYAESILGNVILASAVLIVAGVAWRLIGRKNIKVREPFQYSSLPTQNV